MSQGPTGPQGVQGLQGPQGIQGIQGVAGATGIQGPQGIQGPGAGSTGPTGASGGGGFTPAGGSISVNGLIGPTTNDGSASLIATYEATETFLGGTISYNANNGTITATTGNTGTYYVSVSFSYRSLTTSPYRATFTVRAGTTIPGSTVVAQQSTSTNTTTFNQVVLTGFVNMNTTSTRLGVYATTSPEDINLRDVTISMIRVA